MTIHQNPKSANIADPKCHPDILKLPNWVDIFIFQKIEKYYGSIWCIMVHQNPKLSDIVHTSTLPHVSQCITINQNPKLANV